MSSSFTRTETFSWTEAKVRHLMQKVLSDLVLLVGRGILEMKEGNEWYRDISYLLVHRAIDRFEIQISLPSKRKCGLRYEISEGVLSLSDLEAGGLDLWWIPQGSKAGIVVRYRSVFPNSATIHAEMARRGWTSGGTFIAGVGTRDREYSRGGVGLRRERLGDWDD